MFFQDNSEEDTEGDDSYVSADAEEASEEVVPDHEDVESNVDKDLQETSKDVVEDVEEVLGVLAARAE